MGMNTAVEMMNWQKENAVPIEKAREMSEDALIDKIVIGILTEKEIPDYFEQYKKVSFE